MVMARIGSWVHAYTRSAGVWIHRRHRFRPTTSGGQQFSVPEPIFEANIPAAPGLFAVQVPRPWWLAGGLQPIHFGASFDLHRELMVDGHDDFVAWLAHHRSTSGLYLSICVMDGPDHGARIRESARLRRQYMPRHTHSVDEFLQGHIDQRETTLAQAMDGEFETQ